MSRMRQQAMCRQHLQSEVQRVGDIATYASQRYSWVMTKLEKIENEISSLSNEDFRKLADWIAERREAL